MPDTRKIAKNTLYMYIRMILVMAVTIYTSRVVLDKLGVDDFGLYNAVASVVAVINFLNLTLSTSTSRFLTYDLGVGNKEHLQETFSTAFFSHLLLAAIIIILMESIGLWYMCHKFVVPVGREFATQSVFQLSIIAMMISICIVPFMALITAHEDMNIYATVGILDVTLRLVVVYLLSLSPFDKMITYACLILIVQILIALIYIIISLKRYEESKIKLAFNETIFKEMLGFSGWTTIANLSNTFTIQGTVLLLNQFFSPAIIAAKALADQVSSAIMQFVNNFRIALNPQIIKSYAADEKEESKRLTLKSTVISFDLMLILGLPFIFTMDAVMHLWLKEVPDQAVLFTRLAIISQIVNTVSSSTYIAFVSSGKLKSNAIYGLISGVLFFILLYIIFKGGGQAIWVQLLYLILGLISALIIRPWLLKRDVNYSIKDVLLCYWSCIKVLFPSLLLSLILSCLFASDLWSQILLFICVAIICMVCSYIFMDKSMRYLINEFVINRIKNKQ